MQTQTFYFFKRVAKTQLTTFATLAERLKLLLIRKPPPPTVISTSASRIKQCNPGLSEEHRGPGKACLSVRQKQEATRSSATVQGDRGGFIFL